MFAEESDVIDDPAVTGPKPKDRKERDIICCLITHKSVAATCVKLVLNRLLAQCLTTSSAITSLF